MQTLEVAIHQTAQTWEQDTTASGEERAIIGAVDDTFLQRLMLVLMDLPSGSLLMEEVSEERT